MTKKDYELFALAINRRSLSASISEDTLNCMIALCIEVFSRDNLQFRREKFEEACYEGKHIKTSI